MKEIFWKTIKKFLILIVLLFHLFYFEAVANAKPPTFLEKCNSKEHFCQKITELYKSLEYQKIWNSKRIAELEKLINYSKFEGLNHEQYLKELKKYSAEDELKLTNILIKLAHHAYFGTVSPSKVFERWDFPKKEDRVIKTLVTLIREDRLSDLLRELSPKHEGYIQLKEQLIKFLQLEEKDIKEKIQIKGKLQMGNSHDQIPLVKRKLKILGFFEVSDESPFFDQKLKEAIERFQRRHNLEVDGIIGRGTVKALNMTISERISQIKLNLEKYRWLPENLGDRYIVVNIPSYELKLIEKNRTVLETPIIVGKNYKEDFRPTPLLYSKITQVVINPDWYVPQKIAAKDILPRIKKNPQYPIKEKIKIYQDGKEIDPLQIDWSQYSEDHFPFKLIQKSGDKNALGRIKFHMPNNFDVYLHDTPDKRLFSKNRRAFSSGCIRVEKAFNLAMLLINNNNLKDWTEEKLKEALKTEKTHYISLKNPIPVYILYFTTTVKNSELFFFEDLYGYDLIIKNSMKP